MCIKQPEIIESNCSLEKAHTAYKVVKKDGKIYRPIFDIAAPVEFKLNEIFSGDQSGLYCPEGFFHSFQELYGAKRLQKECTDRYTDWAVIYRDDLTIVKCSIFGCIVKEISDSSSFRNYKALASSKIMFLEEVNA